MNIEQKILKAVRMLRRLVDTDQTKEELIAEQKHWLEEDPKYAGTLDEWIESMRADLALSPEELEVKREQEFQEFLEREVEWDRQEMEMYRDRDRDEWDDYWDDRARSVGATWF